MMFKDLKDQIAHRLSDEYEEALQHAQNCNDMQDLRSAIVEFMNDTNIKVADICKLSERNGIEILKKATLHRLFDDQKVFSPRESTLHSLLSVLGDDLISNYQKHVENNFIEQKVCCDVHDCDSEQSLILFISQHVKKAFGVFRIFGEVNHNACLYLCRSCFLKQREILIKPYSDLMKILVDRHGKRALEGLLDINRSTIDRIIACSDKIKFLDQHICDEIHRLIIGTSNTDEYLIELYLQYTRGELDIDAMCRRFFGQNEYDTAYELKDNPYFYHFIMEKLLRADEEEMAKIAKVTETMNSNEYSLEIEDFSLEFESVSCMSNRHNEVTLSCNVKVHFRWAIVQFVEPDNIFCDTVAWAKMPVATIKSTATPFFWPNTILSIVE